MIDITGLDQPTKLYLISHKKAVNVTIILLTVFTVFTNWQVGEIRAESGFGKNILLAQIVDTSELGSLIEQKAGKVRSQVTSYVDNEGSSLESIPGFESVDFEEVARAGVITTTQDESVIVKPEIPTSVAKEETLTKRNREFVYVVKQGDNLGSIANNFSLKTSTLLWNNNLNNYSIIRPGDKLTIPPVDGILHIVKKNETLLAIVSEYTANIDTIINENNLIDANDISIGQKLFIPGGVKKVIAPPPPKPRTRITNFIVPNSANVVSATKMLWPTDTKRLTQYFTWRHSGLDIARKGSNVPIYASDNGVVSLAKYSGWNGGYGIYTIIDHGGTKKTLYAHQSKNFVSVGERVTKGQVIGIMGNTGRSTGQHLHFEVRFGRTQVNPLKYVK